MGFLKFAQFGRGCKYTPLAFNDSFNAFLFTFHQYCLRLFPIAIDSSVDVTVNNDQLCWSVVTRNNHRMSFFNQVWFLHSDLGGICIDELSSNPHHLRCQLPIIPIIIVTITQKWLTIDGPANSIHAYFCWNKNIFISTTSNDFRPKCSDYFVNLWIPKLFFLLIVAGSCLTEKSVPTPFITG